MIMCVLLCYHVSIRIYYQQGGLFLVEYMKLIHKMMSLHFQMYLPSSSGEMLAQTASPYPAMGSAEMPSKLNSGGLDLEPSVIFFDLDLDLDLRRSVSYHDLARKIVFGLVLQNCCDADLSLLC